MKYVATWMGMDVFEHPLLPERESNFKLDPKVPLSDEFRKKMQAWCDEFFGTHVAIWIIAGRVGVHPNNAIKIRLAIDENTSSYLNLRL